MNLILFFFNPLFGFLRSMKNLVSIGALFVVILFYGLYGYANTFELTSADSYRIAARFCQMDFSWWLIWQMFENGALTDIYLVFVYSIVKLFTSNPKVLFGILGLVYGTFAGLSIRQLYIVWGGKRNRYFYFLVFLFFLILSFFNLQTVRFFTAMSVFTYFIIQYFYFGKKRALIGVFTTPLIHFGFFAAIMGLIVYLVFSKLFSSTKFCYWIMASAFVLQFTMPQSAVNDIMGSEEEAETFSSNAAINRKYSAYSKSTDKVADETYAHEVSTYRQANQLFTKTFSLVNKIGMFFLLTALYKRRNTIVQKQKQSRFFNYVLYSYAIGNIATLLFSNGGRFINLANLLFLFWFLSVFQQNYSFSMKGYSKLLIPISFYSISFFFFNVVRVVSPMFWVFPAIITILDGIGFGAIDFVE